MPVKNPLRIPYTGPLPPPTILPRHANTLTGAVKAVTNFLGAPPSPLLRQPSAYPDRAVLLTGAGISVASGLADYRGTKGTYTLNKTYRPIYYNEFIENHEFRKRYWARSFLGWTGLYRSKPNAAHWAVRDLGEIGKVSSVITQNVDSFHAKAHPELSTIELHGYLRTLVCLTCRHEYSREHFQRQLINLNPAWASFLEELLETGALDTENPTERRKKGLKTNPDGDVDLPDAPYTTFRYPACPICIGRRDGTTLKIDIDGEGAWLPTSNGGILKPNVIMFGEGISQDVKTAAEKAVDEASRMLVLGSSLATYSAWRLVKRAQENGMPIGVVNIGGIRGEEGFFKELHPLSGGEAGVRVSENAEKVLPLVVHSLKE